MKIQKAEHDDNEKVIECPECCSVAELIVTEDEYVEQPGNRVVNEYQCPSCKLKFIPAIDDTNNGSSTLAEDWSRKVDQSGWQERMRANKKDGKVRYIEVRKRK